MTSFNLANSLCFCQTLLPTGVIKRDLFDIRIAGNIVTSKVLGSLEYAVDVLATPLIMVLGHLDNGEVAPVKSSSPAATTSSGGMSKHSK